VRDTNSSLNSSIGTSLMAALLDLCSVSDANSSLLCIQGTTHMTAPFICHLCSMGDTNSSMSDLVGTSISSACLSNPCLDSRLRLFGNNPFLRSLYRFTPKD
jgi:hypothetical protein